MAKSISEQALEDVVITEQVKSGFSLRQSSAHDKSLCLDAGPLIDFIQATQPIPTRRVSEGPRFALIHSDLPRLRIRVEIATVNIPTRRVSEGPSLGVNIADLPLLTRRVVKGDCVD